MSELDGRHVNYRGKPSWVGIVMGDAHTPGHVRVDWREPIIQTGLHKSTDLVVVKKAEPVETDDL
jgi:hypothetical protein